MLAASIAGDAVAQGDDRRLGAVGNAELGENTADVISHGSFRKEELGGNCTVRQSLRQQTQHFALPLGQGVGDGAPGGGRARRLTAVDVLEKFTRHRRVDVGFARDCLSDCRD